MPPPRKLCGNRVLTRFTLAEFFLPHPNCQRKIASKFIEAFAGVTSRSTLRAGFAETHTALTSLKAILNCFARHSPKIGFTLSEVLITLGIIGVVAAMTLPAIIANTRKEELRTGLKKSYSVLQQALQKMSVDTGQTVIPADYPSGAFKPEFMKYFSAVQDCGYGNRDTKPCIPNSGTGTVSEVYRNYTNTSRINLNLIDDGQFAIADGMLILIENAGGGLYITVDVNGVQGKPNRWGHDLFTFQLMNDGKLLPMGIDGTVYDEAAYCSKSSSSKENGIACTHKALTDKNFWTSL